MKEQSASAHSQHDSALEGLKNHKVAVLGGGASAVDMAVLL
jgi:cation diffusion facilitator CzcD-associated flavoprotein CzcO